MDIDGGVGEPPTSRTVHAAPWRARSDEAGRLADVFEDLEQQAAGLQLSERDAELADRARGEYAGVSFADRVHASVGRSVRLTLAHATVTGELTGAGLHWCAVGRQESGGWLVRSPAVVAAAGLSERAAPEAVRPVLARLGFGSALHRWAADHPELLLHLVTGVTLPVRVARIGADFLEARTVSERAEGPHEVLVPFAAIEAVRQG